MLSLFGLSSLAMDEKDVFGTPFPDWECNITDSFTPLPDGNLFGEFQTIANISEPHPLDHIGWQLYFPSKDMRSSRTTTQHIRCLEKHYKEFHRDYPLSEVKHCRSFEFKLQLARSDLYLRDAWPTFEHDLQEYPDYTIACIGLAMYRSVAALCSSTTEIPKIYPQLHYFGTERPISSIDTNCTGKLITTRGTITRVSQQYVNTTWSTYKCKNCKHTRVISQSHEVGRRTCSNCHAKGELVHRSASALNRKEIHRNITVREMALSSNHNNTLDVKVPDGIATSLVPGAVVTVTGILNVDVSNMSLHAVCIRANRSEPSADRGVGATFNATDLRAIREIHSEPLPLKLLVHSICPNLKGMVTIKAGLLLALFSTSSDTHVLLAGSESDSMRQLLERCLSASPKGAWMNNSSQKLDSWVAASLSGFDLCCAERIDILESVDSLEKIMIDSAFSTNGCTARENVKVPARVTLLATALPDQGLFDAGKPFLDNFTMSRAFLERFALVFRMEDTIDPEDDLVCFNGVRLHPEKPSPAKCSVEIPLVRQLKLHPGDHLDPLPIELMRKYIDYARHHCSPEFTEDSTKLLEGFFSQMCSIPQWLNIWNGMKMKQIQNMVRARARIDLSAEVTSLHVMDTIRIVSRSWYDKYDTDDRDPMVRLPAKKGPMKASTVRQFLDVLRTHSEQVKSKLFTMKDLRQLMHDFDLPGVEDEIVERLNMQGYLLKKCAGCYELLV
ncbi:DNA helicase MCM8-like [Anopheles stephensi]|uniref:DNA helicase MCM8-like n=1 Tax=Anopheles stephensi TaxID=30069 RepID=UPI00165878C1|nr:DNA helicase MCM8-like [Anopheles stephensi]